MTTTAPLMPLLCALALLDGWLLRALAPRVLALLSLLAMLTLALEVLLALLTLAPLTLVTTQVDGRIHKTKLGRKSRTYPVDASQHAPGT